MSIWNIGNHVKDSWKEKYQNGNGFKKTISELSNERAYIPLNMRDIPIEAIDHGKLYPSCFNGIGTDVNNHWPYRYVAGAPRPFSRPNSAQIRGPPAAHPKDKQDK